MNGRPEPTSNRGRHAQSTWQRGHLAQAKADYERRREPDDPEWSDYAADLDARSMHYGTPGHRTTRRLYAGAYSEDVYAAALAQLQAQSAEHNRPRPPMTPAQRAHVARIRSAPAEPEPADHPDPDADPDGYREWLYGEMAKVENTPAKMAARLDRIDRDRLDDGRPREWSDDYRAAKGLPAFDPTEPRFTAQIRTRGGQVQVRHWDPDAGRPAAWSGGTFSHDNEPVMTAADALAALDQLDTGVSFTG